ncbi:MAG: outer membrane protein assembly factor BamA [Steroidobacteraceae bacterium]
MNLRLIIHTILLFATSSTSFAQTTVTSVGNADEFTVGDIRVEGLQRISEGTVYNYLPVNIGDRLNSQRRIEAIKALYATGFFRDIELRRDGGTLVVGVLERPSIESFELKGNKDIKTEDLTRSLKNVGLAAGKSFNQSTLDEIKSYLTDEYFSRGKYAVVIDAKVEDLPQNQVKVTINITEGKRAKVRQVNVVGNHAFDEKEIRDNFATKTPHLTSFFKQDDRYSRESIEGDLEKLRSFYMNRGYANFAVTSTQVTIAPEKDDMFVTLNISEGDVYTIGDVKLAGNLMVDEADLLKLIQVKTGAVYSRQLVTATEESIKLRLGVDGYAFAKVEAVPATDEQKHEVALTFLVEPGNRVYVRRVNFSGSTTVNDDVFRRDTRQLEGGYLSNFMVDRSKALLQRLPFVENVDVATTPVPGTADMVDVDFKIKEGLPGQFTAGVSYSETYKLGLNASVVHSNFLGTGNRVALEVDSSKYSKVYSFSHTNPYATVDGIARTVAVAYRDTTQFTSSSSDFSSKTASANVLYGYPLTEYQTVRWGVSTQYTDTFTSSASADQAVDWVRNNGKPYTRYTYQGTPPIATALYGNKFVSYSLSAGWGYDSLNRALFADRGVRHQLNLSYTLPFSDVTYLSASYNMVQLVPLGKIFTLLFNGEVMYAQAVGKTSSVPPYLNSYAGGPTSVRGYRESYLGPRDAYGRPYGGNLRTVLQTELLLPMPDKWRNSARFSLFYDIGNVFSTENVAFTGADFVTPVDYKFSFAELKHSTGLAVQWLAPLGIFRFSYAVPLNAKKSDGIRYADDKEGFQFSVGQAF